MPPIEIETFEVLRSEQRIVRKVEKSWLVVGYRGKNTPDFGPEPVCV